MNRPLLYVASSWRNVYYFETLQRLRADGFACYDFRNPDPHDPSNTGFSWAEIDPNWQRWTPAELREALRHPIARKGFALDEGALRACDACVLVMPCGRSAHLEAGFAMGAGKPVVVYMPEPCEPELMYSLAGDDVIATDLDEIAPRLRARLSTNAPADHSRKPAAFAFDLPHETFPQEVYQAIKNQSTLARGALTAPGGRIVEWFSREPEPGHGDLTPDNYNPDAP